MQTRTVNQRVQQFIEICRDHELKITPQRVAIYQALIQSNRHPTADMMFRLVRKDFPHISFDTVNRTLLTFADIGVVEVVEVFGGPKRFDPDIEDHHHLHCTACGKIIDFKNDNYTDLEVPASITEMFKVISKRVVLKGLCADCAIEQ